VLFLNVILHIFSKYISVRAFPCILKTPRVPRLSKNLAMTDTIFINITVITINALNHYIASFSLRLDSDVITKLYLDIFPKITFSHKFIPETGDIARCLTI
jgi:hypothetical protein